MITDENQLPIVHCICGALISNEEIDHNNRCNEDGEYFGVVSVQCPACKHEYDTSQWGEWDDDKAAIQHMKDYIDEIKSHKNK